MKKSYWISAMALFAFSLTACDGDGGGDGDECVSDRAFFQAEVQPLMKGTCFQCHNSAGAASASGMVLVSEGQTAWLDTNMGILRDVSSFEKDGQSILLSKPAMQIAHEGGKLIDVDSADYKALAELIQRFDSPESCGDEDQSSEHFDNVTLMTPEETLRKATLNLSGRLPTAAEEFRVATGGVEALDVELDSLMSEQKFYERIEIIFNDMFLVERYLGNNNAVDLLDEEYYPNARWYMDNDENDFTNENANFVEAAREFTNNSVAREPLKLASYLVKNNRPFTEIVTAPYMLVNPFTARVYGVTDAQYENPLNPDEWQEGTIPGIPHSGVLSSPMWHNRFPTTPTNRNRHRARMVFWQFLATDVMKLAERPIDPTSITDFNPTMNNANCVGCHSSIDPMAGLMQNWDDFGNYAPREDGWFGDMRKPAFDSTELDFADRFEAGQFLGQNLATDPRFATAMVHHMYRGVIGDEPFIYPTDETDPSYNYKILQYNVQEAVFAKIGKKFIDTNYNLKTVFKELIKSPYFRAKNIEEDSAERLSEVQDLGQGRMLTPELLNEKIFAVTGNYWGDANSRFLLSENEYLILYGGIESDDVIKRITDPNGIMAGIQFRMANEMACGTTARDFTASPEKRRYFPHVEPEFVPQDANGFAIAESEAAIKKNIQHLHWHILGERLDTDDAEITRTYELFVATWSEGVSKMGGDEVGQGLDDCRAESGINGEDLPEDQRLTQDPNYTVRAWLAVVTYLLSDYRFLYE